jgi:hypothetical protein
MYNPESVVLDTGPIYGKNLLVNGVQARRNVQLPGTAQCLPSENMMRDGGCLSQFVEILITPSRLTICLAPIVGSGLVTLSDQLFSERFSITN